MGVTAPVAAGPSVMPVAVAPAAPTPGKYVLKPEGSGLMSPSAPGTTHSRVAAVATTWVVMFDCAAVPSLFTTTGSPLAVVLVAEPEAVMVPPVVVGELKRTVYTRLTPLASELMSGHVTTPVTAL